MAWVSRSPSCSDSTRRLAFISGSTKSSTMSSRYREASTRLAATSSNRSKYDSSRGKIRSFTRPPIRLGSTAEITRSSGRSAETAGDVVLGAPVGRGGEDRVGAVVLDQQAGAVAGALGGLGGEEGRPVRDPGRLLHVVGDDHDRVVPLELLHQVLDASGGHRVEGRAGFVHQDHVRRDGDRPGDAEPLLLAARQREGVLLELVLDLVPQGGSTQRLLHELIHAWRLHPDDPGPEGDVVVDRLGERVRLLKDHADAPPDLDRVDVVAVQVLAVVVELALDLGPRDQVVHAVQAADEGALAAARGADEGGDLVAADLQGDPAQGEEAAVVNMDVVEPEHRLRSYVRVPTRLHLGRDAWTVTAGRWVFAIVLRHLGPSLRHVITEFTGRRPERGAMAGLD